MASSTNSLALAEIHSSFVLDSQSNTRYGNHSSSSRSSYAAHGAGRQEFSAAMYAWSSYLQQLSKHEKTWFFRFADGNLGSYMETIKASYVRFGQRDRGLRIARRVRPVFEFVQLYAPAASFVSDLTPVPAATALGGLTCVLSLGARYSEFPEKVIEQLSKMLGILETLSDYDELFKSDERVQTLLVKAYTNILDFGRIALKFVVDEEGKERSSLRVLGRSFFTSFDEIFKKPIADFTENISLLRDSASNANVRNSQAQHAMEMQFWNYQIRANDQIYASIMDETSHIRAQIGFNENEAHVATEQENLARKEERRQQVLAWIPSVTSQNNQEERLEKVVEGTGRWLLVHKAFEAWRTRPKSDLLWINGRQGTGKSSLASVVINHLSEINEHAQDVAIAFVYCSDVGESSTTDPRSLIGTLLKQLCISLPRPLVDQNIEECYDRLTERDEQFSLSRIEQATIQMLARFSETFIIVDGLDECSREGLEQLGRLCEILRNFTKVQDTTVKVIIFSRRDYGTITDSFGEYATIAIDKDDLNTEDLRSFIQARLVSKALYVSNPKAVGLYEDVENTLLKGAHGVFLWADRMLGSLRGIKRPGDIRRRLQELPSTLEESYSNDIKKILAADADNKRDALRVLLWTANAKRSLNHAEMIDLLAIEPGLGDFDQDRMLPDDYDLVEICGGLIALQDGKYTIFHSSVKDYLLGKSSGEFALPLEFSDLQRQAHHSLAELCLTYLLLASFRSGPLRTPSSLKALLKAHPFLDYAAQYWGWHLSFVQNSELDDLAMQFLRISSARNLAFQICMFFDGARVCPWPGDHPPLHLIAYYNLIGLARSWPDLIDMAATDNGFGYISLDYAFFAGSKEMAVWILDQCTPGDPKLTNTFLSLPLRAANHDWADLLLMLSRKGIDLNLNRVTDAGTALHRAVERGCLSACRVLLDEKVDMEVKHKRGFTPLLCAAEKDATDLFFLLAEAGARVDQVDNEGNTALHFAAAKNNLRVVEFLLKNGMSAETMNNQKRTALHSAATADAGSVTELLVRKSMIIEAEDQTKMTPLLCAAESNALTSAKILWKAGASLMARNMTNDTSLHLVTRAGGNDFVIFLLEQIPQIINERNNQGETALHLAISKRHGVIATILLDHGIDASARDARKLSALHLAVTYEGHGQGLIGRLLETFDFNNAQGGLSNSSPLDFAAECNSGLYVAQLLEAGADVNLPNGRQQTALYYAVSNSSMSFIEKLLEKTPYVDLQQKDTEGVTPLHIAAVKGNPYITRLLLENLGFTESQDSRGNLPIHYAVWFGHEQTLSIMLDHQPTNIDEGGPDGRTLLSTAAAKGFEPIVRDLITRGCDINKPDKQGRTPLYWAISQKQEKIAEILLNAHCDAKKVADSGATPLHYAARMGSKKLVLRLLARGCDGLSQTNTGGTPFSYAVHSQNTEILSLFIDKDFDGTNIHDYWLQYPSHRAASVGSKEVLEYLRTRGAQFGKRSVLGANEIHLAASEGHVHLIDYLREHAVDVDPSEPKRPALSYAVHNGHIDAVDRLIQHGADPNTVGDNILFGDPIRVAARGRFPKCTKQLLDHGAVPTRRDIFGFTALDYAKESTSVWKIMGDWKMAYVPLQAQLIRQLQLKAARQALNRISEITPSSPLSVRLTRMDHLFVAGLALVRHDSKRWADAARLFFQESECPSDLPRGVGYMPWRCDMCRNTDIGLTNTKYVCLDCCRHVVLCSGCYALFSPRLDDRKSSEPNAAQQITAIEDEVALVRQQATKVLRSGIEMLQNCAALIPRFERWSYEMLEKYQVWEERHKNSQLITTFPRPGQAFLKIFDKALSLIDQDANTHSRDSRLKESLEDELHTYLAANSSFPEQTPFTCSGHQFFEIPPSISDSVIANTDQTPTKHQCQSIEWLSKVKNEIHESLKALDMDTIADISEIRLEPNKPEAGSSKLGAAHQTTTFTQERPDGLSGAETTLAATVENERLLLNKKRLEHEYWVSRSKVLDDGDREDAVSDLKILYTSAFNIFQVIWTGSTPFSLDLDGLEDRTPSASSVDNGAHLLDSAQTPGAGVPLEDAIRQFPGQNLEVRAVEEAENDTDNTDLNKERQHIGTSKSQAKFQGSRNISKTF